MIRVLIVEDSQTQRDLLNHLFKSEADMEVVGLAPNGLEAVSMAQELRPNVITMDIEMPEMNGFEATQQIMESAPCPIIIVTASWDPSDVKNAFRAVEACAVTVLQKPHGFGHTLHGQSVTDLMQTVRLMAELKVVTHFKNNGTPNLSARQTELLPIASRSAQISLVTIGISTGGPKVLRRMLSRLPADFPAPILIVQHISPGFLPGLVEWLQERCKLQVCIAENMVLAQPGTVYLAPDDRQMGINKGGYISLSLDPAEYSLRPSVSYLFRAACSYGAGAIGCLMTGMGNDGACELSLMKENGAITFAQDEESSVVFGMPGMAVKLGAALYVMPPEEIADKLVEIVGRNKLPTSSRLPKQIGE